MRHPTHHPSCPCVLAACLSCPAMVPHAKPSRFCPETTLPSHPTAGCRCGRGRRGGPFLRASREGRGTRATRSRARCGRTDVPKSQGLRPSLPGMATCIHYNVNIIYFLIWFPYMVRPWYGSCAESPQGDQAGPSRPWCGVWEDEDIGVLSPPGIADLPSWSPVGPERYYDSRGKRIRSPQY